MSMARKCKETTVDIVKGKYEDVHIVFDTCEEGFHIEVKESGTDKLHYKHIVNDEIKVYKSYQSAINKAKDIIK